MESAVSDERDHWLQAGARFPPIQDEAIDAYMKATEKRSGDYLFPSGDSQDGR
jgi:hypothetical protein